MSHYYVRVSLAHDKETAWVKSRVAEKIMSECFNKNCTVKHIDSSRKHGIPHVDIEIDADATTDEVQKFFGAAFYEYKVGVSTFKP